MRQFQALGHNGEYILKKTTESRKKWHRNRAKNQYRRTTRKTRNGSRTTRIVSRVPRYHSAPVRIWQGGEPEYAVCVAPPIAPPATMCFSTNRNETTEFFDGVRRRMFRNMRRGKNEFVSRKSPRSVPRISSYVDFAKVDEISIAAAVVLAAEYERMKEFVGDVPPTVNLHEWQENVFRTLAQLGLFNILGHVDGIDRELKEDGPTLTMPIFSAPKADSLGEIDESLTKLCEFIIGGAEELPRQLDEAVMRLLTTISEAITNVTQHAYLEGIQYEYQPVGRFWVAATAHRDKKSLTVVVYDQGASIPVTYPRLNRSEKIVRFLRRAIRVNPEFEYENDGTYIRAAMRYGGSRTDRVYRGKGFPQMYELLKATGLGKLVVRSRGGWCERTANGRHRSGYLGTSIGGTLLEWTVDLSRIARAE